jgi:hypothetical protein
MHKNPLWLTFLGIVTLAMFWFAGKGLYHLYIYDTLSASTIVNVTDWSVKEVATDRYAPYAHYSFSVGEKEYKGEDALDYPIYRNAVSMERELPNLSLKSWKGWYNPADPSRSALQKHFPLRELISAALVFGLLLYFIWLGYYVNRKQSL